VVAAVVDITAITIQYVMPQTRPLNTLMSLKTVGRPPCYRLSGIEQRSVRDWTTRHAEYP
jgi:hypothetical protein